VNWKDRLEGFFLINSYLNILTIYNPRLKITVGLYSIYPGG